jgi:hypothetical protein
VFPAAQVSKQATVHIVLALAAIEDMELRSVDISYAFTNSDIDQYFSYSARIHRNGLAVESKQESTGISTGIHRNYLNFLQLK